MRRAVLGVLLAAALPVRAQQGNPFWQPEVRRAIPVEKPAASPTPKPEPPTPPAVPFDNPAWMNRVQPQPSPTPQGRVEVAPTPAPAPSGDQAGDIRLGPSATSDPAAAALEAANTIYARKIYDYAAAEYEKFLISYPKAPGRDMAFFRLGECHRMLDNEAAARDAYGRLLQEFQQGEFAGAGAYRLGEYLFGDKQYEPASIQFKLASEQAKDDAVRLSARYNLARSYEHLNRAQDAAKMYQEVAGVEKNNPYRDYARLSLAEIAAKAGNKKDALAAYEKLAAKDVPAGVRAEAMIKAATLAAELGDKKKAVGLFDKVIDFPEAGDWKAMAFLGSMRLHFDLGDYKKVSAMAEKPPEGMPEEAIAEMLLLSGNAYRQSGNARAARALYDRLLVQYPNSTPSEDARFHRLVSMYQLDDPNLLKGIEDFLASSKDPKQLAQVSLLKAETLFKQKRFGEAGPLYAKLSGAKELAPDMQNKALFKFGWCQAQTGQSAEAVKTYTEYIEKNPGSAALASAILQRALALQQAKDYEGAIKDFDTLIEQYPKAAEREVALQQKALIFGQQQKYKEMIAIFQKLLADYPKSSGAGQANFWIGWAAFEEKDYPAAITSLEAARKLDPAQYGDRAALRIILAYYYQQDRPSLVRVIKESKGVDVPVEITRWLGRKSFEEGDYAAAETFLLPVLKDPKNVTPDILIELAEAQIRLGKNTEAAASVDKYLETAREPATRARGLLASGAIALGRKEFDQAQKLAEEALLLQPEGRYNAEGRLLTGEIAFSRGSYDEAARTFMSVALLYDDPDITPRALKRAAAAYKKADNLLEAEKALRELQDRYPEKEKPAKASKPAP